MPSKNTKAFTLIEIILVIFILALIITTAVFNYVDLKRTYEFLGEYQKILYSLNSARSAALVRKEWNGVVPEHIGVRITENNVVNFADSGEKKFEYDPQTGDVCFNLGVQIDCAGVKVFENEGKYFLQALDSKNAKLDFPLLIFYETGSAELSIYQKEIPELLKKDWDGGDKFIVLRLYEKDTPREKYLVISQIYPKIEQYDNLEEIYKK